MSRKVAIVVIGLLAGVTLAFAQPAKGKIDVPVMAGAEAEFDACPSTGTIVGLDPQGDGFLSVRSGPGGSKYREIDRVYNGMHVFICEYKGPWLGVVYSSSGETDACNVSTNWPRRQAYTGPCEYGWIHSRYVGDIAG